MVLQCNLEPFLYCLINWSQWQAPNVFQGLQAKSAVTIKKNLVGSPDDWCQDDTSRISKWRGASGYWSGWRGWRDAQVCVLTAEWCTQRKMQNWFTLGLNFIRILQTSIFLGLQWCVMILEALRSLHHQMKVRGDDRWSRLNQVSLHILYVYIYIVYTYVIL